MKKIRIVLNGKGAANPRVRAAINRIRDGGQAVLKAFEEVEAGLTNGKHEGEREAFLAEVLSENEKAWEIARTQYEVGKIDLLSTLQMQARVVGSRIAVVNIRSSQLITRVNLHLALGGSFEENAAKRVVEGAGE